MEYVTRQMQTYKTGKVITDQFYIDDDYNVPDAKSDVKKVILGEGTLTVEDMKVVENYIRVRDASFLSGRADTFRGDDLP